MLWRTCMSIIGALCMTAVVENAAEAIEFDPGGVKLLQVRSRDQRRAIQQPKDLAITAWPVGIIDANQTHYLNQGSATPMMLAIANPAHLAIAQGWVICELPAKVRLAGTNAHLDNAASTVETIERDGQKFLRYRIPIVPGKFTFGDEKTKCFAVYQCPTLWLLSNESPGGDVGPVYLRLECRIDGQGEAVRQSEETGIGLAILPPLQSEMPRRARTGLMGRAATSVSPDDDESARAIAMMNAAMGCNYYFDGPPATAAPAGLERWSEGRGWQINNGFRHTIDRTVGVGDGFYIHLPGDVRETMPPEIAFINPEMQPRSGAVAPWALYDKHPWVVKNVLDAISQEIARGNYSSLWVNWEPDAGSPSHSYMRNGDYSEGAKKSFIEWSGLAAGEVEELWPHKLVEKYPDKWRDFRNWELGQWTKALAETIRQAARAAGHDGYLVASTVNDYMDVRGLPVDCLAWGDFPYVWQTWTYYDVPQSDGPFPVSDRSGASMPSRAGWLSGLIDQSFGRDRQLLTSCVWGWDQSGWTLDLRDGFYLPEQVGFLQLSTILAGMEVAGNYGEWPIFDGRYAAEMATANQRIARWENYIFDGARQRKHVVIPVSPYPQTVPNHVRPEDQHVHAWETPEYIYSFEYELDGRRMIAVANTWDFGECFFKLRVFGLDPKVTYQLAEPENNRIFANTKGATQLSADDLEDGLKLHVGATRWGVFVIEPSTAESAAPQDVVVEPDVIGHQSSRRNAPLMDALDLSNRTFLAERKAREAGHQLEQFAADAMRRIAIAPLVALPPQVDGELTDSCWDSGGWLDDFRTAGDRRPATNATAWQAVAAGDNLFIAIDCRQDLAGVRTTPAERDSAVWKEDSVEIILRVLKGTEPEVLQLVVSAAGAWYDALRGDRAWNGIEQVAARCRADGDGWTVEARIPLAELLGDRATAALRINVIRNVSQEDGMSISSWFPTWGDHFAPSACGFLAIQ